MFKYLSISIYLSVYLFIYQSIYLSNQNIVGFNEQLANITFLLCKKFQSLFTDKKGPI